MAPEIMHILFVHSDGFVIKEFHFRFPSFEREERVRQREQRKKWGLVFEDDSSKQSFTLSPEEQQRGKPKRTGWHSSLHVNQLLAPGGLLVLDREIGDWKREPGDR